MSDFHQAVEVGPADGTRFQRLIALVDPSTTYAVIPTTVLTTLGIAPQWRETIQTPGGQEELPLAEVLLKINDQQRTTVCVFGKPDAQPVLGAHTLLSFGLAVDADNQKLVAATLRLG